MTPVIYAYWSINKYLLSINYGRGQGKAQDALVSQADTVSACMEFTD